MNPLKIGVFGPSGRMGKDIVNQISSYNSLKLTYLCEKKGHNSIGKRMSGIVVEDDIKKLVSSSDVIIDFTVPSATLNLMKIMKLIKKKTALVTGTTGFSKSEEKKFNSLSSGMTILRSFNMSVGVSLLKNIVKFTSKNIGDSSDIEIVEIHHNQKRDTPSGTSLSLANSITEGNKDIKKHSYREKNANKARGKKEIGFASIRGGDVIGEHSVFFFLDGERLEFKHIASDRKVFSIGAIKAARWVFKKKPGLYTIMDMICN